MSVEALPLNPRRGGALRIRRTTGLADRFARSAAVTGSGASTTTAVIPRQMAERRLAGRYRVDRIPFSELDGWAFAPGTHNLVHHTGRFFSVEGLRVRRDEDHADEWHQPIINQPEIGILGILAKEFDGVLHFLLQVKMEPGNPNLLQLSPTVQATRSNYTKVHRGAPVPYLEHFTSARPENTLVDVLQAEHGSWFFRKANRNMVVEIDDELPAHDGFFWLTLGQIGELLRRDNLVNMDTRSVLACLPNGDTSGSALHTDMELLSWFTGERTRRRLDAVRVPLQSLPGWTRTATDIAHDGGRHFRVVAAQVEAGGREVTRWTQPLLEPIGEGIVAFALKHVDDVPHVLVQARVEAGFADTIELGPTVQYLPANYEQGDPADAPAFRDLAPPSSASGDVLYDVRHSEEGGRFLDAVNRCLVVSPGEGLLDDPLPPRYRWASLGQLSSLIRHGHYVNVQARTLLAAVNTGALDLTSS